MTSLARTTVRKGIIISKVSDALWRLSMMFGPLGRGFLPPFKLADESKVSSEPILVGSP